MSPPGGDRAFLLKLAREAMKELGLEPDFPPPAVREADSLPDEAPRTDGVRDLRGLLWCSIDNDDSKDLDQLTVAETAGGGTRILVAVADVDRDVPKGGALDAHARANTTSVYTAPQVFPMLPTRLSNDLTSLNQDADRLAVVVSVEVDAAGACGRSSVERAVVRNRAKLAYSGVGPWLEGRGAPPSAIAAVPGLAENLRLQDEAARRLKTRRHELGALELRTIQTQATFDGDAIAALVPDEENRAKELIADFMIAANGVVARFLDGRGLPTLRRVVRSPERWDRIVAVAAAHGTRLPAAADAPALNKFLLARRAADPVAFPDLSLTIVKLMGRGEYVANAPGRTPIGHFGLAVRDYSHSTAPNRRYPDLVTQRLVKAACAGAKSPYGGQELDELAAHCTQKEDDAQKVERRIRKSATALWLSPRVGQDFDGIVTGASESGTWIRVFDPPAEGRVVEGERGLDVGDRVRVRLLRADPARGFIDFACTKCHGLEPRRD